MREPTDKQLEIVEFMRSYQREHGMPPTTREIANEFKFASTNAVAEHLVRLKRFRLVEHRPRIARGWIARSPDVTGELE